MRCALPQRPVPIEEAAVQAGGQFEQVSNSPRRRQCRAPHVVVEVHVVVVGPPHIGDFPEKRRWSLAEGGLDVLTRQHRLIDFPRECRPGGLWRREQLKGAHVDGMFARLDDEMHRVQW